MPSKPLFCEIMKKGQFGQIRPFCQNNKWDTLIRRIYFPSCRQLHTFPWCYNHTWVNTNGLRSSNQIQVNCFIHYSPKKIIRNCCLILQNVIGRPGSCIIHEKRAKSTVIALQGGADSKSWLATATRYRITQSAQSLLLF